MNEPPDPDRGQIALARPLVLHRGALGDSIQLLSLVERLAKRWGAPCDLVLGRTPRSLFAGVAAVGEARPLGSRSVPYWASARQRRLADWIRRRGPGPVYLLELRRHRTAPWSGKTRLEALLERAGVPAGRVVRSADTPRPLAEHAVDYFLRIAALDPADLSAPFEDDEPPAPPRLSVSAAEVEECRAALGAAGWRGEPLILLQAMSRRSVRGRWPAAKWLELGRALRALRPEARLALLGAPRERRDVGRLARRLAELGPLDLSPALPLRRLLALLTFADSLVSVDSGPAHAAAALDCPTVVLAGTADPRRNRPLGPPDRLQVVSTFGDDPPFDPDAWYQSHEMAEIPVDDVLSAWRRLATRTGPAR